MQHAVTKMQFFGRKLSLHIFYNIFLGENAIKALNGYRECGEYIWRQGRTVCIQYTVFNISPISTVKTENTVKVSMKSNHVIRAKSLKYYMVSVLVSRSSGIYYCEQMYTNRTRKKQCMASFLARD